VDDIYSRMTAGPAPAEGDKQPEPMASISTRLPAIRITSLAEVLSAPPFSGRADLPVLAAHLELRMNDLFRVAEIAQMMGFAGLHSGDAFRDRVS
jgi:NitT/TauT family transport system ATP-binding protein